MCWNSGVRKRLKLCSMKKTRKKSGLRRAQRMYQGRAVRQKDARAAGWKRRKAPAQRFGEDAQKKKPPPGTKSSQGAVAYFARARKKPETTGARTGCPRR